MCLVASVAMRHAWTDDWHLSSSRDLIPFKNFLISRCYAGLKGLVHFSEQYRPGEKRDSLCAGDSIDAILLDSRGRDLGKLSFSR